MRNPALATLPDTVVEVRDLAADVAARIVADVAGAYIVDGAEQTRAALLDERDRLTARLREIDDQFALLTPA